MPKQGSVAPRERINVKFVPATGGQQAEVELPLKMVVLGDFSGCPDDSPLEARQAVEIDKNTFDSVMREMRLERNVEVRNVLAEADPDATLRASLKFDALHDFLPDSIAQQVPELRMLIDLREALTALKGPLGNMPSFRKALEELVEDPVRRQALLKEVGEIRAYKDAQNE
jgi:type VI secretion system protein ImpB